MNRPQRIAVVAVVSIGILIGHWWYGIRNGFFDLKIYRSAVDWWAAGHPLYDFAQPDATQGELGFTYPTFAAVLIRPFEALPVGVWIVGYVLAFVVALGLVVWWLVTPVADRHGWPRWFAFGLAFPLATALEPVRETFGFGQINLVLVALVALDLLVLLPRGHRWTGVGIGLATALKLIPGIFIVYLMISRRFRAALVAAGTAVAATLFAFAVAPSASWAYWTHELFQGEGLGKFDYTFNQSLLGLIDRLGEPNRVVWALLSLIVAGYGLLRAAQANRAGDAAAGFALAGMVGSLVSPVSWVHHLFWFVPALVVLVDTGRRALLALAAVVYLTVTVSLVALWEFGFGRFGGPAGFLLSNWDLLLMLVLLVLLPIRPWAAEYGIRGIKTADSPSSPMSV